MKSRMKVGEGQRKLAIFLITVRYVFRQFLNLGNSLSCVYFWQLRARGRKRRSGVMVCSDDVE